MIVADNPINNPESCFFKTKVGEAAVRAGAELMLPKDSYFEQLYVGGETITHTWKMFYRPFREATKVIGISPVKDHNLCKATVTMKNWYGLLGNPRNQFHQNIHGIISDFALMMKPTLVIADGRKLLMRNGPTGGSLNDVKRGDTIVVGTDSISVDSWCVTQLLEKQRHEIVYLDKVISAASARTGGRSGRRRSRSEPARDGPSTRPRVERSSTQQVRLRYAGRGSRVPTAVLGSSARPPSLSHAPAEKSSSSLATAIRGAAIAAVTAQVGYWLEVTGRRRLMIAAASRSQRFVRRDSSWITADR